MDNVATSDRSATTGGSVTELILEVFRLNGRLLAAGDRLTKGTGLTSARWQVIGAIALAGGLQPVANLARNMGLTRQAVQRTVNELETEGFVTFAANPHHQRARLVVLTKKGRAAYDAATARQVPWARRLAQRLRPSDAAAAIQVLRSLSATLEANERREALAAVTNRGKGVAHGQSR
jgi:DNA-binding MarR family transcriptional regulator